MTETTTTTAPRRNLRALEKLHASLIETANIHSRVTIKQLNGDLKAEYEPLAARNARMAITAVKDCIVSNSLPLEVNGTACSSMHSWGDDGFTISVSPDYTKLDTKRARAILREKARVEREAKEELAQITQWFEEQLLNVATRKPIVAYIKKTR